MTDPGVASDPGVARDLAAGDGAGVARVARGNGAAGDEALARDFESHRPRMRAVAYRMLGSLTEAEDAVQEAWIRLARSDAGEVRNLAAWLTTVVGRVCLNVLETRRVRREEPLETDVHVPDPIVSPVGEADPESEALLADSVGLALMVVLDSLEPAERLAFVLHDMFAVPFDDIAQMVGRNPAAARQLASRARRRMRVAQVSRRPETNLAQQREVVDAFLAASRRGDFEALLSVLDPDVVLRADYGAVGGSRVLRGAQAVGRGARAFGRAGLLVRLVLVNGELGAMAVSPGGEVYSVMGLTTRDGRIVEMNILGDPQRLTGLGFPVAA